MMECPCKDCLIIPICKSKVYSKMMKCSIIYDYLYDKLPLRPDNRTSKFELRIFIVEQIVNPDRWVSVMTDEGIQIQGKFQ
jgi:hypothetical protein